MNQLIIILLIILIILVSIVGILLYSSLNKNRRENRLIAAQAKESLQRSAYSDQKIAQDFEVLLNQIQSLARYQSSSIQTMDWMQGQIESMSHIMTNTKHRGNWGEYQLEALLSLYAGQNSKIFSMQYSLDNGKIADAAFHIPGKDKVLCIDSKFPMENFNRISQNGEKSAVYEKAFKQNMKKHIDDISQKYITHQTMPEAVMFIPSEAIYSYVCGKCSDIIEYALKKHVLLCSPTTLAGIVFTLISSTKDFYRASHIEEIEKNLYLLQEDLNRLMDRISKAEKAAEQAKNQMELIGISARRINSRFEKISGIRKDEND